MAAEDQTPRLVREAFHKIVQVILQSRLINIAQASKKSSSFNLVLAEVPLIREKVEAELKRDREMYTQLQVDILVRAPTLKNLVLLERWHTHFSPDDMNQGKKAEAPVVYKKLIILMRAVYSHARILPAYQLFKLAQAPNNPQEPRPFELEYNIASSTGASNSVVFEGNPANFVFNSINTTSGKFHFSVFYRQDCTFDFAQPKPTSIISPIIPNYIDQLKSDEKKDPDSQPRMRSPLKTTPFSPPDSNTAPQPQLPQGWGSPPQIDLGGNIVPIPLGISPHRNSQSEQKSQREPSSRSSAANSDAPSLRRPVSMPPTFPSDGGYHDGASSMTSPSLESQSGARKSATLTQFITETNEAGPEPSTPILGTSSGGSRDISAGTTTGAPRRNSMQPTSSSPYMGGTFGTPPPFAHSLSLSNSLPRPITGPVGSPPFPSPVQKPVSLTGSDEAGNTITLKVAPFRDSLPHVGHSPPSTAGTSAGVNGSGGNGTAGGLLFSSTSNTQEDSHSTNSTPQTRPVENAHISRVSSSDALATDFIDDPDFAQPLDLHGSQDNEAVLGSFIKSLQAAPTLNMFSSPSEADASPTTSPNRLNGLLQDIQHLGVVREELEHDFGDAEISQAQTSSDD